MVPNGYNMIPGGSEPPHLNGELSSHHILTQKEVDEIINILQTYSPRELQNAIIAKQYHISVDQIKRINNGQNWKKDNLDYPIRYYNSETELEEIYALLET